MTELPAVIIWAVTLIVLGNFYYPLLMHYLRPRGLRRSRFEQWLQHFRYQADTYDGERMFAAALCVVVLLAWIAGGR